MRVLCHAERSEKFLIVSLGSALEQNSEIFFAQHGASNFPQLSEADPGISFKPA
jgi:hypothetical protein